MSRINEPTVTGDTSNMIPKPDSTTAGVVPVWGAVTGELEDGYEVSISMGGAPDDNTLLTEKAISNAFDLGTV